jgi:hypothetical protein
MISLPSKDKNGNSFLSYSQISLFLKDKEEYKNRYIIREPFKSNAYIDFGLKVDDALVKNDFSLFTKSEVNTLSKVTRLDLFQKKIIINFEGFYIIGFIDSCSNDFKELIDYKTGGKNKENEYKKDEYNQLNYYAIGIHQEVGYYPEKLSVEFIRREGNLYRGERLKVSNDEPIKIDFKVDEKYLVELYNETINIANEIETFYLEIKKNIKD